MALKDCLEARGSSAPSLSSSSSEKAAPGPRFGGGCGRARVACPGFLGITRPYTLGLSLFMAACLP